MIDGYKRGDRNFFRGHAEANLIPPDKMDGYLDHIGPVLQSLSRSGQSRRQLGLAETTKASAAPELARGYRFA